MQEQHPPHRRVTGASNKEDVKAITGKAGKRWDSLVDKVLAVLAGAFIAWLLSGVAL